jgi:hypothetical protein
VSAELTVSASELAKLSRAFHAIARNARVAGEQVLRGEAGIILKACAGATKVATAAQTTKRARLRYLRDQQLTGKNSMVPVTVTAGAKRGTVYGRVHLRTSTGYWRRTHDAVFRPVAGMPSSRKKRGDHYSDHDWLLLQSTIATVRAGIGPAVAAGRKTIGLARQSWVQIADSLGIRLENVKGGRTFAGGTISAAGIAKARAAIASNGNSYVNGLSRTERSQKNIILTLINRYPRNRKAKMDVTLAKVLLGRVSFFEKNLRLGVFRSIADTARAYPYLRVAS